MKAIRLILGSMLLVQFCWAQSIINVRLKGHSKEPTYLEYIDYLVVAQLCWNRYLCGWF